MQTPVIAFERLATPTGREVASLPRPTVPRIAPSRTMTRFALLTECLPAHSVNAFSIRSACGSLASVSVEAGASRKTTATAMGTFRLVVMARPSHTARTLRCSASADNRGDPVRSELVAHRKRNLHDAVKSSPPDKGAVTGLRRIRKPGAGREFAEEMLGRRRS